MKRLTLLLIAFIFSPVLLRGQSTLTFARMIETAEMRSMGIAIVNPGAASAPVSFTLFGSSGQTVGTATLSVPAGGQTARLANELFPNAPGGWVQATSTALGLRGFWLFGNFADFGDAAEAAASASNLIFPLVSDQSEVTIINTGSSESAVLIRLFGQDGRELAEPVVRVLPIGGALRSRSIELFDPPDWSVAGHIEVTSSVSMAGSVVIGNYRITPTLIVLNAVGPGTSATDLIFPHVVNGRLGASDFDSVISVTNVNATPQAITLTFTPETGVAPQAVQFTLDGKATLRMSSDRLFGLLSGFQSGWVRVTSPLGLIGFALNLESQSGGSTATPGVGRSQTSLIFGHIANLSPWSMGLALVNPNSVETAVQMTALGPDGRVIGTTDLVIPASGKTSRLLNEWIPALQTRTSDGGFVFVRSASPLSGVALFFTRDVRILSNAPAFDLAPTLTFNPRQ
jgi:hypothetical protein